MVRQLRMLFALAIGLHTAMALAKDFDQKEFVRNVGHAQRMVAEGKAGEGIAFWEKLKDKYGGAQGHYENALGDLYSSARMYDKAEKAYLEGIALPGNYPRPYIGLAFVYSHTNKPAEAEKWAKRATTEFPNWWLGYYTLGGIARTHDRPQDARRLLQKSLDLEPQPQTYWLMAIVAYDLKDYRAVVSSMEAAVNRDRQYLADENGMKASAISLAHLRRYKDAYAAVDTLRKRNPKVKEAEAQAIVNEIRKLERSASVKTN